MLPLRPSSGSTLTPIPTHQHHTKAMLSQLVLKCAARSGWAAQAQQHPNQLLVSALLSPSLQPCAAAAAASSFNHTYTSSAAPAAAAAAPDASAAEHTTNSAAPSSIEVSMHGSTALLELNRPKQMNALSTQVCVCGGGGCTCRDTACSACVLTASSALHQHLAEQQSSQTPPSSHPTTCAT